MADFNGASAFDDDPTNAFLARESAILGDAAQQFGNPNAVLGTSSTPTLTSASLANQESPNVIPLSFPQTSSSFSDDGLGSFSSPETVFSNPPSSMMMDTLTHGVQDLSFTSGVASETPGITSPVPSMIPDIEPEAIREHRNRQAQLIAERDAKSERKRQENIETARRAIDSFYENYNNKKERAIKENRENQEALLAALNDTITGTFWERVLKHIDVGSGESSARAAAGGPGAQKKLGGTKDVSRLKAILQNLRSDNDAPGCNSSSPIST